MYPLAAVTVETGIPPVAGVDTPPIAATEITVGLTACTVCVKVTVVASESASLSRPPNSIKYP